MLMVEDNRKIVRGKRGDDGIYRRASFSKIVGDLYELEEDSMKKGAIVATSLP